MTARATPYVVVDLDVLETNVSSMASFASARGVALRPHAKTHKTLEIARLQRDAGAVGLTVATVAEAEVFAAAGFDDLFLGYPLWVDQAMGRRLRALTERATLTVGIDSTDGAGALAAQLPGARVVVEVDSGHHRTGVAPESVAEVAGVATDLGLDVVGAFTFPGHSYAPGAPGVVAAQESATLASASGVLGGRGLPASVLSGGSTPSVHATDASVVTEVRPGVYVFGDAQQWELGTVAPSEIALVVVGTVVSHAGGSVVLDSGSKALGADRAPWATGHGRLLDHPDARITQLSEHHAVVAWPRGQQRPALGARLRVVPNHVCTTVNLADELVVVRGTEIVDVWRVAARGANT